ncbi:hypothetical protein [Neorhizobium sp. AL 9.2.2]|uniref:hypothetical protein n=1 Tax=Neorhizobium sp. AL 9.2.2 TaxID=2712894 RepID=UPI00157297A5|nr:hypothetical protein [Neorhizobium sp. AL 9.2.2]NSY17238.1 hypothetical protein [Neorhizobium sp. AL 9.2.2]
MSRIRSIHPGLMSDEAFMTLTVEHPLGVALLLGLWMEADDDGVFEWKPLTIKAKTIPAPLVDINLLLEVLVSLRFIRKFEASGKPYGAIRNFKLWQRPKLPKVKWPKDAEIARYVGVTSPALPQSLPSDGEVSPQRKEEGGRREEEKPKSGFSSGAGAQKKSNQIRMVEAIVNG